MTTEAGPSVDMQALKQALAQTLPVYLVPALLVRLDQLPLSPNGKVNRQALPAPDWETQRTTAYAAPATDTEQRLAAIWAQVLGLAQVGRHDNFFELCGHSLLAVQLAARIQSKVDRSLTLMDVFQFPTLVEFAQRLDGERTDVASDIVVLRQGRDLPPLFCFDPDGTHVQAYRPLALSMADERLVYGLSLSHLFTMRWQDVSIHRLAGQQVRLIRERQRQGLYRLLGWSNGGVLALAVARLLEQGGDSVAFLGLSDTQPDQAVSAPDDSTPVEELMTYIRRDRRGDFESIPQREREALQQRLASLADDDRLEYAI